jgi:hypothetical protein
METRLQLLLLCCERHFDEFTIVVALLLSRHLAGINPQLDTVDMWFAGANVLTVGCIGRAKDCC